MIAKLLLRSLLLIFPLVLSVGCSSEEKPAPEEGLTRAEALEKEAARIKAEEAQMTQGSGETP